MSNSVPHERARPLAARNDEQSAPDAQPHRPEPVSPIDREIARSQRASAALAASAAVARASFTDSQLEAEAAAAAAGEGDIDTSAWVRTEYAALDHSIAPPAAFDVPPGRPSAHNPVAGTFDPGLVALSARTFGTAGARMGVPIRTRGGAQARFRQESRLTPRSEPIATSAARIERQLEASHSRYDKAEVMPLLATPAPQPVAHAAGRAALPSAVAARGNDTAKLLLSAGLGVVVAVMIGGVAWKQGLLTSGGSPTDSAVVTANVARQAEAARSVGAAVQQLAVAPPAAGVQPAQVADAPAPVVAPRTSANDVDAILAAAARVAPVGRTPAQAPVVAAARPIPPTAAPVAPQAAPVIAAPSVAAQRETARSREAVSQAVAHAQERADSFLGGSSPSHPGATVTRGAP